MKFFWMAACILSASFAPSAVCAQDPRVETKDTDNDGKVDQWITWDGKKPVHFENDRNRDGKADVWGDYQYTPAEGGKENAFAFVSADRNHDGKKDFWRRERNHLILQEWGDLNFDEKTDLWILYTEDGRKKWAVMDKNFDGTPDLWSFYGEKGEGRTDPNMPGILQPIAIDVDEDFDGKSDRLAGPMPKERPPLEERPEGHGADPSHGSQRP
ncbi:MAG: hypothetical protein HY594_01175 [Candidatus Omnitrophica bacterium]|nr:hypothetical protein [Candidatus Omnitrophota bacterium]